MATVVNIFTRGALACSCFWLSFICPTISNAMDDTCYVLMAPRSGEIPQYEASDFPNNTKTISYQPAKNDLFFKLSRWPKSFNSIEEPYQLMEIFYGTGPFTNRYNEFDSVSGIEAAFTPNANQQDYSPLEIKALRSYRDATFALWIRGITRAEQKFVVVAKVDRNTIWHSSWDIEAAFVGELVPVLCD